MVSRESYKKFIYKEENEMPKFEKKAAKKKPAQDGTHGVAAGSPAQVSVAVATNGNRTVTLVLPPMKHYTEEEREHLEEVEGKEAVGACDLTGELIFNPKNMNEIRNPERPELDKTIISTAALRLILSVNPELKAKIESAKKNGSKKKK